MTEPLEPPPPLPLKKYSTADYVFQFITITAGVLIALLINGLVQWNADRALVARARDTIAQEITANRKDLDTTLAGMKADIERLDSGLTFANDMLTTKKTAVSQLNFHVNMADLSDSAWRTAERTGALSHMDYAEVQRLSILYDFQDLIVTQQRAFVSQLADVTAILGGNFDPDKPNMKDLEAFRERMMRLRAALVIHQLLATQLAEKYVQAGKP